MDGAVDTATGSDPVQQAQAMLDAQIVPGLTLRHLEAWASAQTGNGDPNHDKRLSHKICKPRISYQDAIDIYSTDDLCQKAIEFPITECFRQGYELTISDEGSFDDL